MAKRKPKEPMRACAFCNTPEVITRHTDHNLAEHHWETSNLNSIARGLLACADCEKVHSAGRRSRASNIARLKDLPITSPQWGKFLESRKA
jgi:hypothetical protein